MEEKKLLNSLNRFEESFFATQVIVADAMISRFLSFLASSESLMSVISESASVKSYDELFKEAISKEGYDFPHFELPSGKKNLIALVTGLLFAVDCRSLSLIDFVTKYFKSSTSQNSYFEFCDKVIKPYFSVLASCLAEPNEVISDENEPKNKPVTFPEKPSGDIIYWANDAIKIIALDKNITEELRRDYTTLLSGLRYAGELGNTFLLNVTWVGVKCVLGNYNPTLRNLNNIYKILSECGVIDIYG